MNKIVISGYYGFNNIGDESILTSILYNIRTKIKGADITVLSVNPESTEKKHDVHAINRKNLYEIIKSIRRCDLLISGGGSLLQDVTSKRNITYYLAVIFLGIFFRKKVMIYSQGIGPVNGRLNQWMIKLVLNRVDCITVRDNQSKELLSSLGVKKPSIFVTADPVIGLKPYDYQYGKQLMKEKDLVIDDARPVIGFAIRGRKNNERFNKTIAEVADILIEELKAHIVFLPFHFGEDIKIVEEIQGYMKYKSTFMNEKYDVNQMLSIVGNLDILVGVRLHSLIFAAVMNVPMVAISYDPKIDNFMEELKLRVLGDMNSITKEALFYEIKNIWNNEEKEKEMLAKKMESLKQKLMLNEELVANLLS